jgi:hypothetical protein
LLFKALASCPSNAATSMGRLREVHEDASKVIGEGCGKGKGTVAWAAHRPNR